MDKAQGLSDLEPITLMLADLGRKDVSFQILETFAKVASNYGQYDNISKCYFKLKDYTTGIKYGEKALVVAPSPEHVYVTRNNLTNLYNHANYPEKAVTYIRCNEMITPKDPDIQLEKAYAYYLQNRKTEAQKTARVFTA